MALETAGELILLAAVLMCEPWQFFGCRKGQPVIVNFYGLKTFYLKALLEFQMILVVGETKNTEL